MLSLIKSERDQLLKKYAKAKERLLDLEQLKKEKVQMEDRLKDMTNQLIEKADKIKQLEANAEAARKSSDSTSIQCAQCKVHEKARTDLTLELSKAEKAILQARNEKMIIQLQQKDMDEQIRECEMKLME